MSSIHAEQRRVVQHLRRLARLKRQRHKLRELVPFLVPNLSRDRPLWIVGSHNDDGGFKAASLGIDIKRLGLPVQHVVVFSGERSSGWPDEIPMERRKLIRDDEFRLMTDIWGTEAVRLYLPSYYVEYDYADEDVAIVCDELTRCNPGAIVCNGEDDLHVAHRTARGVLAEALYVLGRDLPVVSYAAVWGSLLPNAIHLFSKSTADQKYLGCSAHASQQLAADYREHVRSMDRAVLSIAGQLLHGHHVGGVETIPSGMEGGELFRIDEFDPERPRLDDPIVVVKGLLAGLLDPDELIPVQQPQCSRSPRNCGVRGAGTFTKRSSNGNQSVPGKKPR